ncbi:MAG: hypothetical protein GXP62_10295 [Oligoflexia bacterium]|nr:hypothetical protein [Oligoflexia bacterium]
MVDEKVGWLIPPDDPAALRDALRRAHDQPEQRSARGKAGPARLRERGFTLDAQVSGLVSAWNIRKH